MSKETLVFIFGILLTVIPFLGIPEVWRQYGVVVIGILLILIGYAIRRRVYLDQIDNDGERTTDSFIETNEQLFGKEEPK